MSRTFRCGLIAALLAFTAVPAAAGELKLSLNNGLVTIVADNVPVSQILAEWARVGQTRIVNGEKLMTTVSLQLVDVPERNALDIILRSASGFMIAERREPIAGASRFDRVMILPFSQAPAYSPMPAAQMPQPFVNRPVMATPEFEDVNQPIPMNQQQMATPPPVTLPQPGMLPQQTMPGTQPLPTTSPRPGFLPPPTPPKPGGGGGTNQ